MIGSWVGIGVVLLVFALVIYEILYPTKMNTEKDLHQRLETKAAKRIPIYYPKKNPETGKVDCPNMRMQKEWKRARLIVELRLRYERRYLINQTI